MVELGHREDLFFLITEIKCYCIYFFMHVLEGDAGAAVPCGGQRTTCSLSFYRVGLRNVTPVVRLSSKHLYPPSQLSGHVFKSFSF